MLRITNTSQEHSIFSVFQIPAEYNIIERDIWDFGNSIIISNKRDGFKSFEAIDRFTLQTHNQELYIDIFSDLDGAIAYGDSQKDTREVYQYIINDNIIAEKDDRGLETLIINIKDPWSLEDNDIIEIISGKVTHDIIGIEEKYMRSVPARAHNKKYNHSQKQKIMNPSIALVLDSKVARHRPSLRKRDAQRKNN